MMAGSRKATTEFTEPKKNRNQELSGSGLSGAELNDEARAAGSLGLLCQPLHLKFCSYFS